MWDQTPGSQPYQSNVDNFVIRWTGYFCAPASGNYTFSTGADDRSVIWLNNSDTHLCNTGNSGTVSLTQGQYYPITIGFQEWGGSDYIGVNVQGPSGSGLESNPYLPNSVLSYGTIMNTLTLGGLTGGVVRSTSTAAYSTSGANNLNTISPERSPTAANPRRPASRSTTACCPHQAQQLYRSHHGQQRHAANAQPGHRRKSCLRRRRHAGLARLHRRGRQPGRPYGQRRRRMVR